MLLITFIFNFLFYQNQLVLMMINNIHIILYVDLLIKANLSEWSTLSHYQFIKIRELCVYLPINDYLWSIIPKLEQLTLLDVLSNDYNQNYEI